MELNESSGDDSDECCTPQEIREAAAAGRLDSLPKKSRDRYEKVCHHFAEWKKAKSIPAGSFSENTVFVYFLELSKKYASPTLWSYYSMLKATLLINHNVNIEQYATLKPFLKKEGEGYVKKKAKTFTREEVFTFLNTAPDHHYLAHKVALILGLMGALRVDEMKKMTIRMMREEGSVLVFTLPAFIVKTKQTRKFVVDDEDYKKIVRSYYRLRPSRATDEQFFLTYRQGKCTIQVMGKNKIAGMPKDIALFLKLSDAKKYTGHSFRRTSATLLAEAGATTLTLKKHGSWKSNIAEDYVDESVAFKKRTGNLIASYVKNKSKSLDRSYPKLPVIMSSSAPTSSNASSSSMVNTSMNALYPKSPVLVTSSASSSALNALLNTSSSSLALNTSSSSLNVSQTDLSISFPSNNDDEIFVDLPLDFPSDDQSTSALLSVTNSNTAEASSITVPNEDLIEIVEVKEESSVPMRIGRHIFNFNNCNVTFNLPK